MSTSLSSTAPYKCFLSFGDSRMSNAKQRIARQAKEMNVFDKILVWDENDLDTEFRKKWRHVMNSNTRGYGYWVWKPYIILKALNSLPENAILLYLDVGCHFNPKGKKRLNNYFNEILMDDLGVKAFPVSILHRERGVERRWTKGDIFDFFSCRDSMLVTHTAQIESGHIFIRKCHSSVKFIKEWYQAYEDHYSFATDSPSESNNFPDFIENRHDQSIFSILFKIRGGISFKQGETIPDIYPNPIWSSRDRWGQRKPFKQRIHEIAKHHSKYILFKLRTLFH